MTTSGPGWQQSPRPPAIPTPAEPNLGPFLSTGPGGPKGPVTWWMVAALVGLFVVATAGWSIWALAAGPAPEPPPVAVPTRGPTATATTSPSPSASPTTTPTASPTTVPSSTSTPPAPPPTSATPTATTSAPPITSTAPTPTTAPTSAAPPTPAPVGAVGVATAVPATPRPVGGFGPAGTARLRLEVSATSPTADVSYGTSSDDDVDLDDQRMPYAVEVDVPTSTGYVSVLGNPSEDATVQCRLWINGVLAAQEVSSSICITGLSIRSYFDQ